MSAIDLADATARWEEDGFVVLPGLLSSDDLADGMAELPLLYPSASEFHDDVDPDRNARFRGDQFTGIDEFPWKSVELNLLAVHPKVVALAEALLATNDLRLYSAEAWAKYAGATDYDQPHHRDFLNHTLLVPTSAPEHRQCELFVYLSDVPEELGPPHLVPRRFCGDAALLPNWRDRTTAPELYEHEVSGAGPAGTVVAYSIDTIHRGTNMLAPRGARYTLHVNFRPAAAEWYGRHAWPGRSHQREWTAFVARASVRQL